MTSRYRLLRYETGTSRISTTTICQGWPMGTFCNGALVGAGSFELLQMEHCQQCFSMSCNTPSNWWDEPDQLSCLVLNAQHLGHCAFAQWARNTAKQEWLGPKQYHWWDQAHTVNKLTLSGAWEQWRGDWHQAEPCGGDTDWSDSLSWRMVGSLP